MTFEEQLNRAFETLTERLRGEIDRHVQHVSAELVAAAPYDRDPAMLDAAREELARAVEAARREAHEAGVSAGRDAVLEEARRGLADAREEADRELTTAREEADRELATARDEADRELAAARQEAERKLAEMEARRDVAEAIVTPSADADLERLADAMRAIDAARSLTEMLDTLVTMASCDASGVEVWLVRGGRLHRWPATGSDAGQPPALRSLDAAGVIAEAVRTNATARDEDVLAVPIALAGQVVAVFSANRDPRPENREPRTENLELLVRYTAKSLEAFTAFKTARALTQRPAPAPADASGVAADESSEEDTSARRYARLLVSEIKLYHESAVIEGRRDRDLATRLGGEIARARVMYEQRVPPDARARGDYFQDELVRTLAGGDASLLKLEVRSEKLEVELGNLKSEV
jgi:hypothetical protein